MDIFHEFGELKDRKPEENIIKEQVKKLQIFISEYHYECLDNVLAGLGQLYAAGGNMTTNIDVAGGKGTALFVSEAIKVCCK